MDCGPDLEKARIWDGYEQRALTVGCLALVRAALTYSGAIDRVFLPTPGEVASSFVGLLNQAFFRDYLLPSLFRVMAAFLLSVGIAFPLGVLSSQSAVVDRMVHPIAAFSRYLPVAAFVPLCILWFGIDDAQKIAVIMIGVVFQLILLIAADTSSVPQEMIETGGRSGSAGMRCSAGSSSRGRCRRFGRICGFPRAGPGAELVAGNRGLGYFITQSQRYLDTDKVFAGVLLIGFLGLLTDLAFRSAGRRMFRWV